MTKTVDDFVKELAKEHNLPEFVVAQVLRSPFKFLKHVMDKKEFETVMYPYIGKFGVAPNTKKYMMKHLYERDSQSNNKQSSVEGGGESQSEGRDM